MRLIILIAFASFGIMGVGLRPNPDATSLLSRNVTWTISVQDFSPGLKLDAKYWLVRIVTISKIPSSPGLIMRVPCTTDDPTAGSTSGHFYAYRNLGCVPQPMPHGANYGLY